ncbi:hypothetical protein B0T11DRAFT_73598 [Plectosphaerella cucumerina]|uniref:Uncharacterized protein n=1 Tax=Plectosphaerella cucumerina TaxID=40658 RepID=A0A8K0TQC7_9PEZI|nr:hypothetical protein B0T11DRAFT_73598 [Plectosphaerella cucumerina]
MQGKPLEDSTQGARPPNWASAPTAKPDLRCVVLSVQSRPPRRSSLSSTRLLPSSFSSPPSTLLSIHPDSSTFGAKSAIAFASFVPFGPCSARAHPSSTRPTTTFDSVSLRSGISTGRIHARLPPDLATNREHHQPAAQYSAFQTVSCPVGSAIPNISDSSPRPSPSFPYRCIPRGPHSAGASIVRPSPTPEPHPCCPDTQDDDIAPSFVRHSTLSLTRPRPIKQRRASIVFDISLSLSRCSL